MSVRSMGRIYVAVAALLSASVASATTYNVSSSSALSTALGKVVAGDTVILASGNYSGFTMTRSGASGSPITIQAASTGGAVINSGIIRFKGCSYVNVSGIKVTSSGGTVTVDVDSRNVVAWFDGSKHCQLTRSTFRCAGTPSDCFWVFLAGPADSNRIDHCDFGNNASHANHFIFPCGNRTIAGVTPPSDRTSWANGNGPVNPNMARNTTIDHNYFHDTSSGEAIVLGGLGVTGDYQNCNSVVDSNLFVNCNGDPEIVSVKSSSNIVRFNTVRTSAGVFSLRSGNGSTINGNFFLCGGSGGGVKINEMNHTVYNNYMENTDTSNYPIMLEDGDPYNSSSFAHGQVKNARIAYNTCVHVGRNLQVGHGSGTLHPANCVIANNIITGSSGQTLYSEDSPSNLTLSQNVVYPTAVSGKSSSQFQVLNPGFVSSGGLQKLPSNSPVRNIANTAFYSFITTDMDGQTRSATPDIGADEYSTATITIKPLSTSNVGPSAP